jgi:AcrR family transcriptional regulator
MSKKEFKKDLVLKAAIDIAKEVGFDRLSIRGIAKRLNCSVSPVYDSFECKEDIIHGIYLDVLMENNSEESYFKRNIEVLTYGIKYPTLYRDIRKYSSSQPETEELYNEVIALMKKEKRLASFSLQEMESLNFDILVYISGLVERSTVELKTFIDVLSNYTNILNQVTELLIIGYENAR